MKPLVWIMTLGFALISFAPASHAAITDPVRVVEKVRNQLLRAERGEPPICPRSIAKTDRFVFAFEGANGYCPAKALFELPDPERLDLSMFKFLDEVGYAFERYSARSRKSPTLVLNEFKEARRRLTEELRRVRHGRDVDMDDGEAPRNCNLLDNLLLRALPDRFYLNSKSAESRPGHISYNEEGVPNTGHQKILYYAWNQLADAQACVDSLVTLGQQSKRPVHVSVVGYSFGGTAATEFYESLPENPYLRLERILTIDPVPRNLALLGAISPVPVSIVPVTVSTRIHFESWRNFFQRTDGESLVVTGIRGSALQGASQTIRNTLVTPWALGHINERDPANGHVGLLFHDEVQAALRSVFKL